jgi:hypothetical protein
MFRAAFTSLSRREPQSSQCQDLIPRPAIPFGLVLLLNEPQHEQAWEVIRSLTIISRSALLRSWRLFHDGRRIQSREKCSIHRIRADGEFLRPNLRQVFSRGAGFVFL